MQQAERAKDNKSTEIADLAEREKIVSASSAIGQSFCGQERSVELIFTDERKGQVN